MTTAERIDVAELEIIQQFFQYSSRMVGHFTDAELIRMVELGPRHDAGKLNPADAAEYQALLDRVGTEKFCFTNIDHLIADIPKALDRLEAAGMHP